MKDGEKLAQLKGVIDDVMWLVFDNGTTDRVDYCRDLFDWAIEQIEWHRVTGEEQGDEYNILAIGSDNEGYVTSLTEMNRVNAYMRTSPDFQETDLLVWYMRLEFPRGE